jgi:glycosyltransferase involved in cell wall biosynthesis
MPTTAQNLKRLLWVGDAGCPSGFARATHEILDTLRYHYDVTVLGINYRGDPHDYPYKIYAAEPGGDAMGIGRLVWMCDVVKPDVIVLQNDPWNIPIYLMALKRAKEHENIPVIAAIAVDGKNCAGAALNRCKAHNGIALGIFWTQFGLNEAQEGGYAGPAAVIPLGVDVETYRPMDKSEARRRMLPETTPDGRDVHNAFIVGSVNRNQPRKRWDLMVKFYSDWLYGTDTPIASRKFDCQKVKDTFLYLHTAPTGDTGVNVSQLARYYGVLPNLILTEPPTHYGVSDEEMCATYNCLDVMLSTTQGEGFGLTTMEAAACRKAIIAPRWSALGELLDGAAWLVKCSTTHIGPPYVNVIGGVIDEEPTIEALWAHYRRAHVREQNGQAAYERAHEDRFRWVNIGDEWIKVTQQVLAEQHEEVAI